MNFDYATTYLGSRKAHASLGFFGVFPHLNLQFWGTLEQLMIIMMIIIYFYQISRRNLTLLADLVPFFTKSLFPGVLWKIDSGSKGF